MRINRYLAYRYGSSRREADEAIAAGKVFVNSNAAVLGQEINAATDTVLWPGKVLLQQSDYTILMINKPVGFVCSRDGQGSPTVYDLLPEKYHSLKIAGRLDKDSSGLVILTNDGDLIQAITHPSQGKLKEYTVTLNKPINDADRTEVLLGVDIGDEQPSRFTVSPTHIQDQYLVTMGEGRNRQIRRTFDALGYTVIDLHRLKIGDQPLGNLKPKEFKVI